MNGVMVQQIQLSDNSIDDEGIEYLTKYSDTLKTLKIANNKIKSLEGDFFPKTIENTIIKQCL